jgi:trehalose utilization protein
MARFRNPHASHSISSIDEAHIGSQGTLTTRNRLDFPDRGVQQISRNGLEMAMKSNPQILSRRNSFSFQKDILMPLQATRSIGRTFCRFVDRFQKPLPGIFLVMTSVLFTAAARGEEQAIRVLIWDEQQPRQKEAYDNFLGEQIAGALKVRGGLAVRSRRLDDPEQGLAAEELDQTDVIVWWGHVRQHEVSSETAKSIVDRIKAGQLDLIALHSAHWSNPFIEAMNERTRQDAARLFTLSEGTAIEFEFVPPPGRFPPIHGSRLTPGYYGWKRGSRIHVRVDLPNCCFPDYRPDGEPSTVFVKQPDHPIAAGLPATFRVPHTEMYNEPFHVPEPDVVVFEEHWEKGERFRSGMVWKIGKGRVFYFRPGHETFDVYHQPETLQVVENAVRWLGRSSQD